MPAPLTASRLLLGLDERHGADEKTATRLINWTWDALRSGWDNRIGYEPFFSDPELCWAPWTGMGPVDSVHCFPAHGGALETWIIESGGTMYQLMDQATVPLLHTLDSTVAAPLPGEPAAVYAPYGRFLFRAGPGGLRVLDLWPTRTGAGGASVYPAARQYGWSQRPEPPRPWQHHVNPWTYGVQEMTSVWAALRGDARAPQPYGVDEVGLGSRTGNATNAYRWAVTYVSSTGSESPRSDLSEVVRWDTPVAPSPGSAQEIYFQLRRAVIRLEIPVGPPGTVARRIYRTLNLGDRGTVPETLYYEDEIPDNSRTTYWSYRGDEQLGSEGPGLADSVPLPHQARHVAVHMGCAFQDGGQSSPTLLRWSRPNEPESYDALDYVDLSGSPGGAITGLVHGTDLLLVLRERAIYGVAGEPGSFRVVPVLEGVGSLSPRTAAVVPNVGLCLLTTGGIYAFDGALVGGGTVRATRISDAVEQTLSRLTVPAASRAVGAYSALWREYHVYMPVDGFDRCSLGLVLHESHPAGIAWSVRAGFPVGCLTTSWDGELVFGHATGIDDGDEDPSGLYAISRLRWAGGTFLAGAEQEPDLVVRNSPVTSVYRSAWLQAPAAAAPAMKGHVRHVYVEAETQAGEEVSITVARDGETTATAPSQTAVWQRADREGQPIYDMASWGASTLYQEPYAASVRYDVAPMACSTWAWEISTTVDTVLLAHTTEGTVPGKMVIGGRT